MTRGAAAQALLREASQLFRAGRHAEAVVAYERLFATGARLPDSWFNYAMALRAQRRPDDALAAYGRALQLGISGPEEVHLQRGVILADDLGRSSDALAELQAALKIVPAYVPALLNLGNLHEDLGDRGAARDAYARVLAVQPNDPLALARSLGLADTASDAMLPRVRAALAHPSATLLDRADLGFALGAALDKVGDFDAAFDAYAEANRASAALAAGSGIRYDPRAQEQLVDRIIAAFPLAAAAPPTGRAPIFICGMFRSGSTLAEAILAAHSGVVAGGELHLLAGVASGFAPYPEATATATAQQLTALRDAYLAATALRHALGQRLTDKRPDNFLHVGLIKALFPDARIVHTVRDAPDNHLSVWFLHASPAVAYATDLGHIAHYDAQHRRLMAHWRTLWPDAIFELDYDRLVADPEPSLTALLDFCGLAPEPGLLERRSTGAVRTASNWQVREPLYRRSSGRWRNYAHRLDRRAASV